jgi:hypothetical protein
LTGPAINTYEGKVLKVLEGTKIEYLNNSNSTPVFNKNIPYYKIMNKTFNSGAYSSFITPFNNEYATNGASIQGVADSQNAIIRNTWINNTAWQLYLVAFYDFAQRIWKKTIHSSTPMNTLFFVKDTARYTDAFLSTRIFNFQLTDTDYVKSRICYEQIMPKDYPREKGYEMMVKDLNDYYDRLFGMRAHIEQKKFGVMFCSKLVINLKSQSQEKNLLILHLKRGARNLKGNQVFHCVKR